jgi:hypothetical protein
MASMSFGRYACIFSGPSRNLLLSEFKCADFVIFSNLNCSDNIARLTVDGCFFQGISKSSDTVGVGYVKSNSGPTIVSSTIFSDLAWGVYNSSFNSARLLIHLCWYSDLYAYNCSFVGMESVISFELYYGRLFCTKCFLGNTGEREICLFGPWGNHQIKGPLFF